MSNETRDALEQALANHVSDETGKPLLVTGFVLGAAVTSFEGEASNAHLYVFERPDNQPIHVSRGLATLTEEHFAMVEYVVEMDEDDD